LLYAGEVLLCQDVAATIELAVGQVIFIIEFRFLQIVSVSETFTNKMFLYWEYFITLQS